ncbi:MAG: hypothetical protein ACI9QV_001213, partial [Methylophagaceae bacterium]
RQMLASTLSKYSVLIALEKLVYAPNAEYRYSCSA